MRSIARRFSNLQQKQPEFGSFLNFGAAIKNRKFSVDMIHRWFYKLVEKSDYDRSDTRRILKHLVALSCPEDNGK
jgi:hypothetical protein